MEAVRRKNCRVMRVRIERDLAHPGRICPQTVGCFRAMGNFRFKY
jgi:hypothetical protein